MKSFSAIILLVGIVLAANVAFAETKKSKSQNNSTSKPSPATVSANNSTSSSGSSNTPDIAASFGIGTFASNFHFGVLGRVEFPFHADGHSMSFGGQTGFLFGVGTPSDFVIPILATFTYKLQPIESIKPYFAIGTGIAILVTSGIANIPNTGTSSANFALLFRPGANLGKDDKLFVELPIGTLGGSSFAFIPSMGMHF